MYRRIEAILWGLIALPLLYLAYCWPSLPERVPTHFGLHGQPDDYSDKSALPWMVVGLQLFIYLLMRFAPLLDAKGKIKAGQPSFLKVRLLVGGLASGLGLLIVHAALSGRMDGGMMCLLGLFFAGMGWLLPSLPQNTVVGVRTPWTILNEENWRRTSRWASRLWIFGGVLLAVLAWVLPMVWLLAGVLLLAFAPVLYSLWLHLRGGNAAQG